MCSYCVEIVELIGYTFGKRDEMTQRIIKHFITLTKIPHCSSHTEKLKEFLIQFARGLNYKVELDHADNILIKKGKSSLVLQAHYDMVCMGSAPHIETMVDGGWLGAKDSSLGADNGIAIAMMMVLMERGEELTFLLTSDEEIGLIGAGAIGLKLNATYMLNLDYEDEAIVCIGCAGGADIMAERSFEPVSPYQYFYELNICGLPGGHSGVEIHKNIPNAIKVLADYLQDKEVLIASAKGGERRNSIPSNISMQLSSKVALSGDDIIHVKPIENKKLSVYKTNELISLLCSFQDGVNLYNEQFNLPDSSINLAMLSFSEGVVRIECSSRSMSDEGLEKINKKYQKLFEAYGFSTVISYKYSSWKPKINEFTSLVKEEMGKVFDSSEYQAIHAGLECGVFLEKYPDMQFASIGPTIVSPHSIHERVKLASIGKTFEVLEKIISKMA